MRTIADLKPGDHLCCIYETEEEHRAVLTPFLRQGLERGEKVIYIADERIAEAVLDYLRDDGLDPQPYLERGQLIILTRDDAYLRDGFFDPDGMIALLREETERALAEGYAALRVTGEMTWALRGLPGSGRLIDYEAKLNEFFPGSRCLAICQYDRRRFPPDVLLEVLRTHPVVMIGTEVYDNFYYKPPESAAAELERWIENLRRGRWSEERAVRQLTELRLIEQIYASLRRGDDLEKILRLVSQDARELFGGYAAAIYYLEDDGKHLVLWEPCLPEEIARQLEGLVGPLERRLRLPLVKGGRFWQVVHEREALLLNTQEEIEATIAELAAERPALRSLVPTIARITRLRSVLVAPLIAEGEVVGVISVGSPKRLTEEDREWFGRLAAQVSMAMERAWARERERELQRKLEAIHALGQELVLTHDERYVAQAVVEAAARVLGFEFCGIWLVDAEGGRAVRSAHVFTDQPADLKALPLDGERGIIPAVIRSGQPIYLPDVREDPRYIDPGLGSRSEFCVPLKVGGKVLGVLNAESQEVDGFDEKDRRLLSTLANYAALALANAEMFNAMRAHARELEALNDLGRALASRLRIDEVAEEAYRQASRLLDTTNFYVALYDAKRDEVTFVLNVTEGQVEKPYVTRRAGRGLTEHVIRTREPLLIRENVAERLRELGVEPIGRMAHSWLGVPMLFADQVVGVIAVQSYITPRAYGEHERDLLTAIAAQAAVALENARLFEEAHRLSERLALVAEVARQIGVVRDLDELLHETAERIVEAFGYDYVAIMLLDPETEELVFRTGAGVFAGRTPEGFRQRIKEGMIGWTAYLGETLLSNDVTQESRYIAPFLYETRSELDVPLKHQGRVIGVLDIQSSRLNAFDDQDVRAMEALAGHIATAIENARMHVQLRSYAEELEQRVAERTAELCRERERIQAILDAAGEGIVVTDMEGRVVYMNPAAEAMSGFRNEEMQGRLLREWAAPEAAEGLREMRPVLRAGRVWRGEGLLRRKDGTSYDARLTIAPIPGEEGRPGGFVGVVEDISHLKELDRLKSQFISDAAHELRTPVTTIKLYADLLQREHPPERQAEYLRMLAREADLMAQLVEDLLDLSRLERGVARFEPEPLDLNEVVADVVERCQEQAEQAKLVLSFEPGRDLPPVTADREQIERALTNLVVNAINYTPAGGRVTVCTAVVGERVEVSVIDTGYGISEEERERIFDRFFRGHAARESKAIGSGLGLSIVREILNRHGGGIEVESEVGKGSTFTLWLPV